MKFLIDLLIGIILLALCYIIFVVVVKLHELAELNSELGRKAKKINRILNYTLVVYLTISVIVGIVGAIILLLS